VDGSFKMLDDAGVEPSRSSSSGSSSSSECREGSEVDLPREEVVRQPDGNKSKISSDSTSSS
jgi:hypothetical protein